MQFILRKAAGWWLPLLLAECATVANQHASWPSPTQVRAEIGSRMPTDVPDRTDWATDIQATFIAQRINPNAEKICAVLAVTAQEASFHANPTVPNLPRICAQENNRRAAAHHVPQLLVDAALTICSPDGRSYSDRLRHARTERELNGIYEDLIASLPLGKRLFSDFNPVETEGPMQVNIAFAEARAGVPLPDRRQRPRRSVHPRRRHVFRHHAPAGIPNLLHTQGVPFRRLQRRPICEPQCSVPEPVSIATNVSLALDGDLLTPGAPLYRPGDTERAPRALGNGLGLDARSIRNALQRGNRLDFDDTLLYGRIYALADVRAGERRPRASVPGIQSNIPKLTR